VHDSDRRAEIAQASENQAQTRNTRDCEAPALRREAVAARAIASDGRQQRAARRGPARDRRQSREGIEEPLIQLSNPDVSKADRFTGIGMGLQFDGGGIELLVKRLSDV
jgi:hypothetical protein